MKICPRCNTEHNKNGMFCCKSCSNSRSFSEESKLKKSIANKQFFASMTDEEHRRYHEQKMSKFDIAARQRKVQEKNRIRAWSKPYEEMTHESCRKRLLYERNNTCEDCGICGTYNGKPITLELDHIDGDHYNNKLENLRILCPNCHSQTPTYRGRNMKYKDRAAQNALLEMAPVSGNDPP